MDALVIFSLCLLTCSVYGGLIRDDLLESAIMLTFIRRDPGHELTAADYYNMLPRRGRCSDTKSDCPVWAARGDCDTNPAYMQHKCKQSCNSCDASCQDSNAVQCPQWSMRGECSSNPRFMLESCKRSCGRCSNHA